MNAAANLPAPAYKKQIVKINGYNSDIVEALNSQFPAAVSQSKNVVFSGDNFYEKGRAIFNYLKNNIAYKKDRAGVQTIQLPSRMILDTRAADCKSLGLAAAAFMYNNNFKNVRLRYASYNANDNTPTHVYAVGTDDDGNDIIIDAVYKSYNKELPYTYAKDYPMKIQILSGTPPPVVSRYAKPVDNLPRLLMKLKPGGTLANVVRNEIARRAGKTNFIRYDAAQLNRYRRQLERHAMTKNDLLRSLVQKEIRLIQLGAFVGNIVTERSAGIQGFNDEIGKLSLKKIFKKAGATLKKISPKQIFRGIKTVGLVLPRKAFLALVSVNARGIASRMAALSEGQLKKIWVDRFGGKLSVLKNAISRGRKRRPLIGNKRVRAVSGIGFIVDDSIGAEATGGGAAAGGKSIDVGALVAAAAPIIQIVIGLLKKMGVKEPNEAAGSGEDNNFSEAAGFSQDAMPKWQEYLTKAGDIAENLGIIPDKNLTPKEQQVDAAIPGDDHDDSGAGSSFAISPEILLGGAAALGAIIYFSKRKTKK